MDLATIDAHRGELNAITTLAADDLTSYVATIADESPGKIAGQVRAAAPAVVEAYGDVAATNAALFYEVNRPKPGWTGRLATLTIADKVTGMLGWSLAPLFFDEPDMVAVLSRLAGGIQKHVSLFDRETVSHNSRLDPLKSTYTRFARGNACAFCAYLSSLDIPIKASDKDWHNNCHCVQVPSWEDNPLPANPLREKWADAASAAQAELERLQRETPRNGMKRKQYFAKYPELAVVPKNITRIMRRDLGLAH